MALPVIRKLLRAGAIPGANLGAAFTASLVEQSFSPDNAYLDRFEISAKADTVTAPVTMPTFGDLLNPFIFKVNGLARVQARLGDLWALNAAFLNRTPGGYVANTTSDDAKMRGVHVPVWETVVPNKTYTYAATRVAQTNVSGEVLTIASRALDRVRNLPLHYVELQYTSAGATGITQAVNELPRLGDLRGILVFETTVPSNTADTATISHFTIKVADQIAIDSGVDDISIDDDLPINNDVATDWGADLIDNYRFFDFRDAPINARDNKVAIDADVQATSEAVRFLPIYQLPA